MNQLETIQVLEAQLREVKAERDAHALELRRERYDHEKTRAKLARYESRDRKHLEAKVWAVVHVIVLAIIDGTTTAFYSRSTSVGVALSMVCGAQLFVTVRAILRLVQFEE